MTVLDFCAELLRRGWGLKFQFECLGNLSVISSIEVDDIRQKVILKGLSTPCSSMKNCRDIVLELEDLKKDDYGIVFAFAYSNRNYIECDEIMFNEPDNQYLTVFVG